MNTRPNNFYLLLTVLFLVSCGTENEEILEVPETNKWIEKAKFSGGYLSDAVSFIIDDKLFVGTGVHDNYVNYFYVYNYEDNSWGAITSLPSDPRANAISFSIGKYGYVGLGTSCIGSGICTHYYYNDLWRYNPENEGWTRMADFPGTARAFSTCFVIDDKAYVTGGSKLGDNDLWEYNSSTDAWTKKTDYPGGCSSRAVSFSLNNKGYVGFGWSDGACKDFWEYDPLKDTWIENAQFPGEARYGAVAFSFMGKGYLACGINQDFNGYNYLTDFWEYDYINDSWIQINTNYPGEGRINMIAGVIENKIIMGLGAGKEGGGNRVDDIWEYTPEQK
jgi:N-acetylneuraminic acid mutarotase